MSEMNGKQLSDIRHRLGWTQEQAGKFIGYDRTSWARMENGTQGIKRCIALSMLYHLESHGLSGCEHFDLLSHYTKNYWPHDSDELETA